MVFGEVDLDTGKLIYDEPGLDLTGIPIHYPAPVDKNLKVAMEFLLKKPLSESVQLAVDEALPEAVSAKDGVDAAPIKRAVPEAYKLPTGAASGKHEKSEAPIKRPVPEAYKLPTGAASGKHEKSNVPIKHTVPGTLTVDEIHKQHPKSDAYGDLSIDQSVFGKDTKWIAGVPVFERKGILYVGKMPAGIPTTIDEFGVVKPIPHMVDDSGLRVADEDGHIVYLVNDVPTSYRDGVATYEFGNPVAVCATDGVPAAFIDGVPHIGGIRTFSPIVIGKDGLPK
jgi:hypothetical protein